MSRQNVKSTFLSKCIPFWPIHKSDSRPQTADGPALASALSRENLFPLLKDSVGSGSRIRVNRPDHPSTCRQRSGEALQGTAGVSKPREVHLQVNRAKEEMFTDAKRGS